MLTGQQKIDAVRELLNAPILTDNFYDDTQILLWINLYYHRFIRRTHCVFDMTNASDGGVGYNNELKTVANQATYSLPADAMEIDPFRGVWWLDETSNVLYKVEGKSKKQLEIEGLFRSVNVAGLLPKYYTVNYLDRNNESLNAGQPVTFSLYPYPDTADLHGIQVHFTPLMTDILVGTTGILTKHEWDWVPVYGAVAMGKRKRLRFAEAQDWERLVIDTEKSAIAELEDRTSDLSDTPIKPYLAFRR